MDPPKQRIHLRGAESPGGEYIYEFNREFYRQMEGGAIGVRLAGEIAQVIERQEQEWWQKKHYSVGFSTQEWMKERLQPI